MEVLFGKLPELLNERKDDGRVPRLRAARRNHGCQLEATRPMAEAIGWHSARRLKRYNGR